MKKTIVVCVLIGIGLIVYAIVGWKNEKQKCIDKGGQWIVVGSAPDKTQALVYGCVKDQNQQK